MLHLALTTLLALQGASASPSVASQAPSSSSRSPRTSPAPQASPQGEPGARTSPAPTPTPGPAPKAGGNVLAVVNKSDDTVSILDGETGRLRVTAPVEPGSHEIEALSGGAGAAVAAYGRPGAPGRLVTILDLTSGKTVSRIDIGEGSRPHGLKALRDGRLLVTAEGTRELVVVDPRNATVAARIPTGRDVSHMVAASPDGKRAYVTSLSSGSLLVVDLFAGKMIREIPTGKGTEGLDVTPDGHEVWVANRAANTISVVDTRSLEVVSTIPAAEFPIRVRFTHDGKRAVVTFTGSGDVAVFDPATRRELGRVSIGRDAVEGTETRVFQKRFGKSPAPIGLLLSPDGRRAYVSASHADVVAVIDLDRMRVEDAWTTGREPDGLAGRLGGPKPTPTPAAAAAPTRTERRYTPRPGRTPRYPVAPRPPEP